MAMMENKEFQNLLSKYPDDFLVGIALTYNDTTTILWDIEVKGIRVESEDLEAVILINNDLNIEYETLLNGAEIDEEEIYGE